MKKAQSVLFGKAEHPEEDVQDDRNGNLRYGNDRYTICNSNIHRWSWIQLALGADRLGADLVVVPAGTQQGADAYLITGKPVAFYMNASVLQQVEAIPGVAAASPQIFLTSLQQASCCSTGNLEVVALNPSTDFTIVPWLSVILLRRPSPKRRGWLDPKFTQGLIRFSPSSSGELSRWLAC